MVDFLKIVAITTVWTMLFLYWVGVIIAALEGFSLSVIFYIAYGIFATVVSIFYAYWIRSM